MIGSYYLLIQFGQTVIPISPANLKELTITQDLNRFLPEFRLRINDNTGALTHVLPFDKAMSRVYIELAENQASTDKNAFLFDVYRRKPSSDQSSPSAEYDISGLHYITNLFSPDSSRGLTGSIQASLQNLALTELGANATNVGNSLNYILNLIQPRWTNVQFLNYLAEQLIGNNGEYDYRTAFQVQNYNTIFLFKSLAELMTNPVSYKFSLADQQYQDRLPIYNYSIYDNYKLYGAFGNQTQNYSYFNWETGTFIEDNLSVQDFYSLADYWAIDKSDPTGSNEIINTGRTNDFHKQFQGYLQGNYAGRLLDLVKMWITTKGLPNAIPGQVVQVFFPQGVAAGNLYSYQYSGYWLIEQVVHNCGDMFVTKLLLTRHGVDTDKKTTLLPATISKRV